MCRGGQSVQYQFNPPLRMHVAAPRARSGRGRRRRAAGACVERGGARRGTETRRSPRSTRIKSAEAPSPNALQDVGVRLSDGTVGLASVF